MTRLNVAMAVVLTLAVISGVAVTGVRLATPARDDRGAVSVTGDAKTELLAAIRRTFASPVRISTTMRVQGNPDATTETDVDYVHHEAIERVNGTIQMVSVNGRAYQRISEGLAKLLGVPAGVQWQELAVPPGVNPATPTAAAGGWGSIFGLDPSYLDDPVATAKLQVAPLGSDRFEVTGPASGQRQTAVFTVSRTGLVAGARIDVTMNPPAAVTGIRPPSPLTVSAFVTITALDKPLGLTEPAASTVLTQAEFRRLEDRRQVNQVQNCSTSPPSPGPGGSSEYAVGCSATLTVTATAKAVHR